MGDRLPVHVAFKGDNGKYLQVVQLEDGHPYLQFSSDNKYDISSGFHVEHLPQQNHVWIKSDAVQRFWRLNPSWWILADEEGHSDPFSVEWVEKATNTIALRKQGDANYCARLPDFDGKIDCLKATGPNITKEAMLVVEDLAAPRTAAA